MPEGSCKGVVEAQTAQRAHGQGNEGGRVPGEGPTEGQEQQEQVVGAVIVQVALDPRHKLVPVWDACKLPKELADGPRGLAPVHLQSSTVLADGKMQPWRSTYP